MTFLNLWMTFPDTKYNFQLFSINKFISKTLSKRLEVQTVFHTSSVNFVEKSIECQISQPLF